MCDAQPPPVQLAVVNEDGGSGSSAPNDGTPAASPSTSPEKLKRAEPSGASTEPSPLSAYTDASTWKHIGRGSFATVYRAYHKENKDQAVAIKRVSKKSLSPKLLENIRLEIDILASTKHENIVRLYSAQTNKNNIYLIMEYCNAGDLSSLIKQAGPLLEELTRKFVRQIASALKVLHDRDVIHRDLKPQNLLLCFHEGTAYRKHAFTLKMTDFGFARYLATESMADTMCGTPLYMAPEILTSQQYDGRADLWSLGAIVYECLVGKAPYPAKNVIELVEKFKKKTPLAMPEVSSEMHGLLARLLVIEPTHRMNHAELFAHPIVMGTAAPIPKASTRKSRSNSVSATAASATGSSATGASASSAATSKKVGSTNDVTTRVAHVSAERQGTSTHGGPRRETVPAGLVARQHRAAPGHADLEVKSRLSVALQETQTHARQEPPPKDEGFVVVDKPWAEVNQFADDMAARPTLTDEEVMDKRAAGRNIMTLSCSASSPPSASMSASTSPIRAGIVSPYSAPPIKTQSVTAGAPVFASYVSTATARLFGQSPPGLLYCDPKDFESMSASQAPGPYVFKEKVDDTTVVSLLNRYSQTIRILIDVADSDVRMLDMAEGDPAPILPATGTSRKLLSVNDDDGCTSQSSGTLASQASLTQASSYGGDTAPVTTRRQKALVLYLKGLSLMQGALDLVKEGMDQGQLSRSRRLNECVQQLRALFNQCLEAAENLQQQGVGPDLSINADLHMYEKALQLSKDAVLNEILGNIPQSDMRYRKARALLDGLLLFSLASTTDLPAEDAGAGGSKTALGSGLFDTDAIVIQNYISGINQRIKSMKRAEE